MLEKYLDIKPEIKKALEDGKAVVALESTIISHGMPYPRNVETALHVEQIIRDNGAIPATIAIGLDQYPLILFMGPMPYRRAKDQRSGYRARIRLVGSAVRVTRTVAVR